MVKANNLKIIVALLILIGFILISPLLTFGEDFEGPPKKLVTPEDVNPKLQTVLQEIALMRNEGREIALEFARKKNINLKAGEITVIIEPSGGDSLAVNRGELSELGVEVDGSTDSLLRVSIPLDKIEQVSTVSGVEFIRLPYRPVPVKNNTSQGVEKIGASAFHSLGVYGRGSRVAIIDIGFDGLSEAKISGDLPPDVISSEHDYSTSGGIEQGSAHGTAVAEIVHDVAPEAGLYLMKVDDEVGLGNAMEDAVDYGVDVINHSVAWYNTSFYDGTGTISDIATDAFDNGIIWINAAGNEAQNHWQGGFRDVDGDGYLDFSGDDECNSLGWMNSGTTVKIYMTWNAWPKDPEDYDLYLYNGQQDLVATSDQIQNGNQPPTEYVSYNVTKSDEYCFAISKFNAPTEPEIDVFIVLDGDSPSLEYGVPESSILDPACDQKVVAVGSIYQANWTTGHQESFSSRGPTNASKFDQPRIKPDIMGPDGVSTYSLGTFYGTSASSPHIAGAAALLLSEKPSRLSQEVVNELLSNAVDMGLTGKDNIYGFGRVSLSPSSPVALFTYSPFNPAKDQTITFDASNSTDPNGSIVVYRWDWEDDGVYEHTTSQATVSHSFSTSGEHTVRLQVEDNEGEVDTVVENITVLSSLQCSVGLYDQSSAVFFLKYGNSSGNADLTFNYGIPNWKPITGDWNGDGIDTVGLYVLSSSSFFLRNENSSGVADESFNYGMPGWLPIAGDWDGDNLDTVGLYNQDSATFFLKYSHEGGSADLTVNFGPGDNNWVPIAGDWDADNFDEIGLYNPETATFYLKYSNESGTADNSFVFGIPNWNPVAGDWDGDGGDTVGLQTNEATFYLKNSLEGGIADISFNYGLPGWTALAGNWVGYSSQSKSKGYFEGTGCPVVKSATATPNPVHGERVNFKLHGTGIDSVLLRIYSQSGELIFESDSRLATDYTWDLSSTQGTKVPNGVYLYTFIIRGENGEQVVSDVRKLLVLR